MDEDFSPQRFAALFQDFLESLDSLVAREDRLMRADVRVSMEPLTNMIEHSAPILRSILGAGHHDHPDDQYEWDDSGPEPPAWQATFDG